MDERPVQDFYPQKWSHCYGCGRLNEHGLHVQTSWLDDQAGTSRSRFTPEAYHVSLPGFVYGGLLASLIDCHGTGTATLAAYRAEQRPLGSLPQPRFVTGSLHVDNLRPTPLTTLTLIGRIKEASSRDGRVYKVAVDVELLADGRECVRGHVVAILAPADFGAR